MTNSNLTNQKLDNIFFESTKEILKYLPTFYLYKSSLIQNFNKSINLSDPNIKKAINENKLTYEQFYSSIFLLSNDSGNQIEFNLTDTEDNFKFNLIEKAPIRKNALHPYQLRKTILIQSNKQKKSTFTIDNLEYKLFKTDFHEIDLSKINKVDEIKGKDLNIVDFKLTTVEIDSLVSLEKGDLGIKQRDIYRSKHKLKPTARISTEMIESSLNTILDNKLDLKRTTSIPVFSSKGESKLNVSFHTTANFSLQDRKVKLVKSMLKKNYQVIPNSLENIKNKFVYKKNKFPICLKEVIMNTDKGTIRFVLEYYLFDKLKNVRYKFIPFKIFENNLYNPAKESKPLLLEHPTITLEGLIPKSKIILKESISFENSKIDVYRFVYWRIKKIPITTIDYYIKEIDFSIEEIIDNLFIENKKENYSPQVFNMISDVITTNLTQFKNYSSSFEVFDRRYYLSKQKPDIYRSNVLNKDIYKTFEDTAMPFYDGKSSQGESSQESTDQLKPVKSSKNAKPKVEYKDPNTALDNYKTFLYVSGNSNMINQNETNELAQELGSQAEATSYENEGTVFRDYIKEAIIRIQNIPIIHDFASLNNISTSNPKGKTNLTSNVHIRYNTAIDILTRHRRGNVQPRLLKLIEEATIMLKRKFKIVEKVIINSSSSMDIPTCVEIAAINASNESNEEKIVSIKKLIPGLDINKKNYKKRIKILAGRYNNGLDANHSGGYGVDVRIKLKTDDKSAKFMCLWKSSSDKDFKIAAYFTRICKELGASGIGAGMFYADYPNLIRYNSNNPPLDLEPGLQGYNNYYIKQNGEYIRGKGHPMNEIHIDILKDNLALSKYLDKTLLETDFLGSVKIRQNAVKSNLKRKLRGWGADDTSNTIESWLTNAIGVENRKRLTNDFRVTGHNRGSAHSGSRQMTKWASVDIEVLRNAAKKNK
jgi:hypothetical protein